MIRFTPIRSIRPVARAAASIREHGREHARAVFVGILGTSVALSTGLSPVPVHAATTWQDAVGAQTPDKGIQALAFLPNELWINAGDSVAWSWNADEPHTVSLGALGGVTFSTPEECNGTASTASQCTWDGSSTVTSGLQEDGAHFTVTFMSAGDVAFRCLLHRNMTGTLHVRPAGTAYPHDQAFYDRQGAQQARDLIGLGRDVLQEDREQAGDGGDLRVVVGGTEPIVTTSGGRQSVFTPRFTRSEKTVSLGDTVTFTAPDALAPHTVTFGAEPTNPFPPANLMGPGEATTLTTPYPQLMQGPTVSAGVIGDGAAGNGSTFQVTFNAPGVYQYYCAIHDELGMVGTVRVVARQDRGETEREGNRRGR